MWRLDPTTLDVIDSCTLTIEPATTVTGINSLTADPDTGIVYGVAKTTLPSDRQLVVVDPATCQLTVVGGLGDRFASLTFVKTGDAPSQLFGVTGNGAATPETLFTIDKQTGATTLATALGNGADGETIQFNPTDGFLYHWSGNGTVVFERVDPLPPFGITAIPFIGGTAGESFGAWWNTVTNSSFVVTNIASGVQLHQPDGTITNITPPHGYPDDLRGLALAAAPAHDVQPRSGSVAGGTVLRLTGSFLVPAPVTVTIDGVVVPCIVVDDHLEVVTPPGATPGPVLIESVDGARIVRWPGLFSYVAE